jgi:hypothetical protein
MIYYLFIWLKEKPTTQISMHPWGGYENPSRKTFTSHQIFTPLVIGNISVMC